MECENVEFALCLSNEGYPASLETGKLYRVVPDKDAAAEGYLRIIDESGEDYVFTADRFYLIDLRQPVKQSPATQLQPALEFAFACECRLCPAKQGGN